MFENILFILIRLFIICFMMIINLEKIFGVWKKNYLYLKEKSVLW